MKVGFDLKGLFPPETVPQSSDKSSTRVAGLQTHPSALHPQTVGMDTTISSIPEGDILAGYVMKLPVWRFQGPPKPFPLIPPEIRADRRRVETRRGAGGGNAATSLPLMHSKSQLISNSASEKNTKKGEGQKTPTLTDPNPQSSALTLGERG